MKNKLKTNLLAALVVPLTMASVPLGFSTAAASPISGTDSTWREAREHALAKVIDPDQYECGDTDFNTWIAGKVGAIENFGAFLNIYSLGALDWAAYYSLIFDNDDSDEYFGVNGELTRNLRKQHKDLQGFWDVSTSDVQLHGMHGADLSDDTKMVPLVKLLQLFGFIDPSYDAQVVVDYVQSVIESDPGLGFNNPLFTLNAFASTEGEDSPFYGNPDKIIMGDGIGEMLVDIGMGTDGVNFVHAHEFGHQVQFEIPGLIDSYGTPEGTRRIELMVDGFGAYYCAHARGATFQAKRFASVLGSAYAVGDCGFDQVSHHGTPLQREAAAQWGEDIAKAKGARGHIKGAVWMYGQFDIALPTILDAPSHD